MKALVYGKEFNAKETNGKYFYFSTLAGRWLPTSKKNIICFLKVV
jgi:hypothetical protein